MRKNEPNSGSSHSTSIEPKRPGVTTTSTCPSPDRVVGDSILTETWQSGIGVHEPQDRSGSGLVSAPPAKLPSATGASPRRGGKNHSAFGYDIEISMVAYVRET